MPTHIQALSVLSESRKADEVFSDLGGLFRKRKITYSEETNVIFNDHDDEEREPELASSEEEAIKTILSWPALGGTKYSFVGNKIGLYLDGIDDYCVDAVTISIIDTPYSETKRSKTLSTD